MEYVTFKENGTVQEEIKKSKFICHVKRVSSEEEARDFINAIKKEHYKATHNCSAFMKIGEMACVAVHPDYRSSSRGEVLLERIAALLRLSGNAGQLLAVAERSHDLGVGLALDVGAVHDLRASGPES